MRKSLLASKESTIFTHYNSLALAKTPDTNPEEVTRKTRDSFGDYLNFGGKISVNYLLEEGGLGLSSGGLNKEVFEYIAEVILDVFLETESLNSSLDDSTGDLSISFKAIERTIDSIVSENLSSEDLLNKDYKVLVEKTVEEVKKEVQIINDDELSLDFEEKLVAEDFLEKDDFVSGDESLDEVDLFQEEIFELPEPDLEPEPAPIVELEPEPLPEPEPEPAPIVELEPEPVPEPEPAPIVELEPEPAPIVELEPEPEPRGPLVINAEYNSYYTLDFSQIVRLTSDNFAEYPEIADADFYSNSCDGTPLSSSHLGAGVFDLTIAPGNNVLYLQADGISCEEIASVSVGSPEVSCAEDPNGEYGVGTVDDPYIICSATDLVDIENNMSKAYVIGVDLDLAGLTWNPLGKDLSENFTGILDGRNHELLNLTIDKSGVNFVGLFWSIGEANDSGKITRLKISSSTTGCISSDNCDIQGGSFVGSLAGQAINADISYIVNEASIKGSSYVGGLIGFVNGRLLASYIENTGEVNGSSYVGGFVGRIVNSGPDISFDYGRSIGEISGGSHVGGVVGSYTGSGDLVIGNTLNQAKVVGVHAGGFLGFAGSSDEIKITNSHNQGEVLGSVFCGGFLGLYDTMTAVVLEDVLNSGILGAGSNIGGLIGSAANSTLTVTRALSSGSITSASKAGAFVGRLGYPGKAVTVSGDSLDASASLSGPQSGWFFGYGDSSDVTIDNYSANGSIGVNSSTTVTTNSGVAPTFTWVWEGSSSFPWNGTVLIP